MKVPAFCLAILTIPTLALAQQTPSAQTHTVREGDTLWDIARQYLGDPVLWPQIYRINTDVVEDPHWIYPGEVLRLVGGPDVASVPTQDTPAPVNAGQGQSQPSQQNLPSRDTVVVVSADTSAMSSAAPSQPGQEPMAGDVGNLFGARRESMENVLRAYSDQPYRPLRRSEFYSSGFLSEDEVLPFGKFLGPVSPPQIATGRTTASVNLFTKVALTPPAGASYQVGDTLLVVRIDRHLDQFGDVIVPTGMLRVTDVSQAENTGEVIAVYGPIRTGQLTLPAEKFMDPGEVRAVPISDGVQAALIESRDRQVLKGPQDVVFIDKGRADGVAAGDIFELRRRPESQEAGPGTVTETMAVLQIVHVRQHTATARVLNVLSPDIGTGTPARQVAKLPS